MVVLTLGKRATNGNRAGTEGWLLYPPSGPVCDPFGVLLLDGDVSPLGSWGVGPLLIAIVEATSHIAHV